VTAALPSSLDFLQGTFEKIRFQRLFSEDALQFSDLIPQFALMAVRRWIQSIIDRLHLIPPLVQLVRWIPSSDESSVTFLHVFSRSIAIFRNACGYLFTFFFPTRSSFRCKV
jgi:hypothetical protein